MIKLIPDDNDIARYAGPSKINKKTGRLSGAAFLLRNEREEYLSVYCLNMLPGDDDLNRIEYLKKDIPLGTKAKGKLGVINVGTMKRRVERESRDRIKLTVTHEPQVGLECEKLNCDYHCGIRGIEYEDEIVAEMMAECVNECYFTLKKSKTERF